MVLVFVTSVKKSEVQVDRRPHNIDDGMREIKICRTHNKNETP